MAYGESNGHDQWRYVTPNVYVWFENLTLLPWNSGRSARWDVTVVDTLGRVYLQQSVITGASEPETTAVRKTNKYEFTTFPVALETLGPTSASAQEILTANRKALDWGDDWPSRNRFSLLIAVQRFNAASFQFPSPHRILSWFQTCFILVLVFHPSRID